MKRSLLFLFLFFAAIHPFSQDSLTADSVPGLKLQRYLNNQPSSKYKPVYISAGQKIWVRTHQDHHKKEGVLTAITDSSLTIDSTKKIFFSDIDEIAWYDIRMVNSGPMLTILGGTMMAVGTGLLISPLLIDDSSPYNYLSSVVVMAFIAVPVIIAGVAIAAAGVTVASGGKWQKRQISNHWRISASQVPVKKTEPKKRR